MEHISKKLTDSWKEIIESINIDGYSRKVESVTLFRMNAWYTGHPDIEFCYKVTFDFEDTISNYIYSSTASYINDSKDKWHKELEDKFTQMFWNPVDEVMPKTGSNHGEVKFENSKVDYMTNQRYRFIIQFYPAGFLPELRNEKLEILGII